MPVTTRRTGLLYAYCRMRAVFFPWAEENMSIGITVQAHPDPHQHPFAWLGSKAALAGIVLAVALILFVSLTALNGLRPVALTHMSAADFLPMATFGSVLIGSVAAGVAGFAFSAITGSLLFHWVAPMTAVPLLLACSITTQLF